MEILKEICRFAVETAPMTTLQWILVLPTALLVAIGGAIAGIVMDNGWPLLDRIMIHIIVCEGLAAILTALLMVVCG